MQDAHDRETLPGSLGSGPVSAQPVDLESLDPERRYERRDVLGSGGMGEVYTCRDHVIGRDVAMKVLRGRERPKPAVLSQFVREARLQGQLEHPSVAPVYDLAVGPDGPYFTMKRVGGHTLGEVVEALRAKNPNLTERFTLHRLLTGFQQACLCIEYAHSRGVVHRDLKPSNIIFGDFGEVYVLDWGLASLEGEREEHEVPAAQGSADEARGEGAIVGTPGYLAPEQLRGADHVDRRADVYALGAVLFEILTLEPLHPGPETSDVLRSTESGAETRASVRAPDREVPPELEAVYAKATATAPEHRHESLREMHEEIERYLEGDRDLARRRDLADDHVRAARGHVERAIGGHAEALDERGRALTEIGRALVMCPDHDQAHRELQRVLAERPRSLPGEAAHAISEQEDAEGRSAAKLTGWAFAAMAALALGLSLFARVESWPSVLWMVVPAALGSIIGFVDGHVRRRSVGRGLVLFTLGAVTVSASSSVMGPLVMTPTIALAITVLAVTVPALAPYRWFFLLLGCLVVLVPSGLEIVGIMQSSYLGTGHGWEIVSRVASPPAGRDYPVGLLVGNLAAILIATAFVWRMASKIAELRRESELHAWHMRQLMPQEARSTVGPRPSERPPRP